MIDFLSFSGYVTMISDFNVTPTNENAGCYKMVSVVNNLGNEVRFIVSPTTYVVDHEMIKVGDFITAHYDGNAPAVLIYPPQFPALVIVKETEQYNVKVDYFNKDLVSSDGMLKLNLSPTTQTVLTNGQVFTHDIANRNLIVIYRFATHSIPSQTTPVKIVVLCT